MASTFWERPGAPTYILAVLQFSQYCKIHLPYNVQQFMKHLIETIIKEDTRTSMKLIYLHIVIRAYNMCWRLKYWRTGVDFGEWRHMSLDIFNVKKIGLLIDFCFFCSSSHDYYDSKGTRNVQKNFCTTEQKLLTRATIKNRKLKITKTYTDTMTMRLLINI